jgi:YggT family protein
MLYQILAFLLEVTVTLIGGACLLRLAMRWQRLPWGNPVGRLVLALTDWLVPPLQRLMAPRGRLDAASLLAVWLLKLGQYAVLLGLAGLASWAALPLVALLGVARLAVSAATAMVIVAAVLSWAPSRSPALDTLERLCAPLLAPIRRLLPLVGGVDLSPLVAIVALQVAGMVLGSLQAGLLGGGAALLGAL